MSGNADAVTLTPIGRKYVRYVVAFSVTLSIGLAPLLGRVNVPGFTAIAQLFPVNLKSSVIPFAAFLMAVPALAVQYYAGDTINVKKLTRMFSVVATAVVVLALLLYTIYTFTVVTIDFAGGRGSASYIVGSSYSQGCPCRDRNIEITACVGRVISFDPSEVTSCYPAQDINKRKALLSLAYLLVMLAFGALVGLVVIKESIRQAVRTVNKAPRKPRAIRTPV